MAILNPCSHITWFGRTTATRLEQALYTATQASASRTIPPQTQKGINQSWLKIGRRIGTRSSLLQGGGDGVTEETTNIAATPPAEQPIQQATPQKRSKEDKLWTAEYRGSGTFIIHKPKRNPKKLRQLRLKSREPGMRK